MRSELVQENLQKYIRDIGPLKDAFDLINDHVVITDENANILYANKAAEIATGYGSAEIIGKNPADLWGGNMPKEFYEKMWNTIKIEKKPFFGEVRNTRRDGSEIWQEIHISPVLGHDGSVKYFIAIEPNITSNKRREELNGEFTSIVGHQLKAPLTAVRLVLEWLLSAGGLTMEQKNSLEGAYANISALSDLVADLLLLRKIDYSHLQSEIIDLGVEINEVVNLIRLQFPLSQIKFNLDGSSFKLLSSKQLARQVFVSLITNAVEYSVLGSPVEVKLSTIDSGYIFSCTDHGIGIPDSDKGNIFGRFFRASNASHKKEKGTGLGLFIVKIICENFGWNIYFESQEKVGTTFFVEIPR